MPRNNVDLGQREPLPVANRRGHHSANWKNKDKCLVGFSSASGYKCHSQSLFYLMKRAETACRTIYFKNSTERYMIQKTKT